MEERETDDAIVVSPDHGVGLFCSGVNQFAVHAVEGASGACAEFQRHVETVAGVVLQPWSDQR